MTDQIDNTQLEEIAKATSEVVAEKTAGLASEEFVSESVEKAVAGIEIPSVEGFAKSEQIDEVKSALAAMEAKLDELPAIHVKEETKMTDSFYMGADKRASVTKSFNIVKAELTPNNSADAPVGISPVWADLVEMNPFRARANVFPVTSASFKTFQVSGIQGHKNESAGSQTEGGAVGNDTVNVNDYNSLTRMNENLVDDLPGLDAMVARRQGEIVMDEEHQDIVSVLDAATITEVDADISDTALATLTPYQSLIGSLPNQYWANASWFMSSEAYGELIKANMSGTGSPLAIDPVSGGFTLYGRPIYVSGHMDTGSTAGDNPVYFGDFSRALWIGTRQDVQFRRSMDETVGALTYYTNLRSGQAVVESQGLRRLNMVD